MSKIRTPAMERYDRRHKSAKKTTPGAEAWRRFTRNRTACVGLLILLVMVVFVIGANWIAPYEYQEMGSLPFQLSSGEHLFGTDNYGRDLFSRCVYGARYTLFISVLCVVAACFSGGLLGIIAGYFGGKADEIIMRIMDILQAIPAVLLAICISSALGNGIPQLVFAIMIASMPVLSRNFRAAILNVKNAEYVESSRSIGVSEGRMILKHMLPNSVGVMVIYVVGTMSASINVIASLSYMGCGLVPPTPEWGLLLSEGKTYFTLYPHLVLFPALMILLTVLSLNMLGDGLRDALDPRLK